MEAKRLILHFDGLNGSDKLSTASKPSGLQKSFLVQKTLGFDTLLRWRCKGTQPALVPQPAVGFRRRVLGPALMGYRPTSRLGALTTYRGSDGRLEIDGAERGTEMRALLSCAIRGAPRRRWRSQTGCVHWVT